MFALTAAAWVVDAGLLLWIFQAVQTKLQAQAASPDPWYGTATMIVLIVLLLASLVASVAVLLLSDARWARISALVMAGAVPGTGIAAMAVMMLGAIVIALTGGRFN